MDSKLKCVFALPPGQELKEETKTKDVPDASQETVPVEKETQGKSGKKKGKPTKTKPLAEEPSQDVDAAMAQDDPEDQVEEDEAMSSQENKENSKPGSRSKQKQAGLIFPIIRMRKFLKNGKLNLQHRCLLVILM